MSSSSPELMSPRKQINNSTDHEIRKLISGRAKNLTVFCARMPCINKE